MKIAQHFLDDIELQYKKLKNQVENALTQIDDHEFFTIIGEEDNSIAILVKHITGNMKSRWTDFLTTDGEKSFRNRPDEFEHYSGTDRATYMEEWKKAWKIFFATLNQLSPEDVMKTITIRQEEHSVLEALHRQMTHYAAHVGQIVFLSKYFKQDNWKTLSIPKDKKQFTGGSYKSKIE